MNVRTAVLPLVLSAACLAAVAAPAGTSLAGVKWTPRIHSASAVSDPVKKAKATPDGRTWSAPTPLFRGPVGW